VDADGIEQRVAADSTATVALPKLKGSLPPFCSSTLDVRGPEVKLPSGLTILSGKGFAGRSFRNKEAWANGELYLMSFYIYGDGSMTQYDVVVEQSADRSSHEPHTETDRADETVLVIPTRIRARPAVECWYVRWETRCS
jgi:hypothetical protein